MESRHTLVAYIDHGPESVERSIVLLRRKNFPVRTLALHPAPDGGASQLVVEVTGTPADAARVRTNLEKLLNVRRVVAVGAGTTFSRGLALVRVRRSPANSPADARFERLCQRPGVRILHRDAAAATLEITGEEGDLDAWIQRLTPFGIEEVARSGAVAVAATEDTPPPDPTRKPETGSFRPEASDR